MIIGVLLLGVILGVIGATVSLLAGFPLWYAFVVFSLIGSFGAVGTVLAASAFGKLWAQVNTGLGVANR